MVHGRCIQASSPLPPAAPLRLCTPTRTPMHLYGLCTAAADALFSQAREALVDSCAGAGALGAVPARCTAARAAHVVLVNTERLGGGRLFVGGGKVALRRMGQNRGGGISMDTIDDRV